MGKIRITCWQNKQSIQTWRLWFYEMICGQLKIWTHVSSHSSSGISFCHFPGGDHTAQGCRDRGNLHMYITEGGKRSTDPADGNWVSGNDSEVCSSDPWTRKYLSDTVHTQAPNTTYTDAHTEELFAKTGSNVRERQLGVRLNQLWNQDSAGHEKQQNRSLNSDTRRKLQGNIVPLW